MEHLLADVRFCVNHLPNSPGAIRYACAEMKITRILAQSLISLVAKDRTDFFFGPSHLKEFQELRNMPQTEWICEVKQAFSLPKAVLLQSLLSVQEVQEFWIMLDETLDPDIAAVLLAQATDDPRVIAVSRKPVLNKQRMRVADPTGRWDFRIVDGSLLDHWRHFGSRRRNVAFTPSGFAAYITRNVP